MTSDKIQEIFEGMRELDFSLMDNESQALYLSAIDEFADKIRPLIAKYSTRKLKYSCENFKHYIKSEGVCIEGFLSELTQPENYCSKYRQKEGKDEIYKQRCQNCNKQRQ